MDFHFFVIYLFLFTGFVIFENKYGRCRIVLLLFHYHSLIVYIFGCKFAQRFLNLSAPKLLEIKFWKGFEYDNLSMTFFSTKIPGVIIRQKIPSRVWWKFYDVIRPKFWGSEGGGGSNLGTKLIKKHH